MSEQTGAEAADSLFDHYPLGVAYDEMLAEPGSPRTAYKPVFHTLRAMTGQTLKERADTLARSYLDQGVTFDYAGEERPFPLDAVPRVISAHEWQVIESGVVQRVTALESFLDDIYSREGEIPRAVHEGVIPWRLIASSKHYHRAVMGIRPANGVRVHVSGVDLVRDEEGTFRVLEDNVRVPSGVSYVIANRRAMANVFPEAFATMRIRPVHDYPRMLLGALRAAAPDGASDPTVVVLTPGVFNSAYFEHALLARMMGVELVEGRDLVCVGGQVRMRTTTGDRPVDVIYRRVDDEFLDPVHFRGDSVLGVAGLVSAMRSGRVTVANAVGNGVADDKLIYSYLPDLIRFYLDEDPILRQRRHLPLCRGRRPAARARPPRRDGRQAGRRLRWQGPGRRAPGGRRDARPAARPARGRPARVDRPAGRPALDGADLHRRPARPAPRRPAPLRGQRRRAGPGAARWPDPRRAAGGRARRQLQPGRRLQGHLGALRPPPDGHRDEPPARQPRGGRHERADGIPRGQHAGPAATAAAVRAEPAAGGAPC